MMTMTVEEQIAELRDEVAHADDLVERLVEENQELRMRVEILSSTPVCQHGVPLQSVSA